MAAPWTPEREARLVKLWNEGVSCSLIATFLGGGITKNSVIGRVHRLKLPRRRESVLAQRVACVEAAPARKAISRPLMAKPPRPAPKPIASSPPRPCPIQISCEPVTISDLTEFHCCWPLGDPLLDDSRYCGGIRSRPSPYCDKHRDLACGRSAPNQRTALKTMPAKSPVIGAYR